MKAGNRIRLLGASVVVTLVTAVSIAQAEPRTHDGLYLRFAAGYGPLRMSRKLDVSASGAEYPAEYSDIDGTMYHLEVTLGATPIPGFVVGGSLLSWFSAKTEFRRDDGTIRDLNNLGFVVFGPCIDGFAKKTRGFHVGFLLGGAVAWAHLPKDQVFDSIGGLGGAASLAVGGDWWIADEWSLGFSARLTGALIHGEHRDRGATAEENSSLGAGSVAFTTLFH